MGSAGDGAHVVQYLGAPEESGEPAGRKGCQQSGKMCWSLGAVRGGWEEPWLGMDMSWVEK